MKRPPGFSISLLLVAMGAVAMAAQIVILRRLIVAFGGNELVSGAVFTAWLFWSGAGNLAAGRLADRIADPPLRAVQSLIAMALAIPFTIAGAALVKPLLGVAPPVMVGLSFITAATLLLLAPQGFLIGWAFTLACRLPGTKTAADIGRVYALDAIGCGIGGLLFSFVAIRYFSSFQASLILAAFLVMTVGAAFRRRDIKVPSILVLFALAGILLLSGRIEAGLTAIQWRGYHPIAEKESLFANLMVTENHGEGTLFIDGRPSFSLPLPETYETPAHFPLSEHPDPRDVLVVGGGIEGMIDQFRQWGLRSAAFARLDPDVTMLEQGAMPPPPASGLTPLWSTTIHGDGRRLIRDGLPDGCLRSCLDVIIVDVGDPDTAAADRYFTVEFFAEAARILRPDGILALSLLEPSNIIGEEQGRVLGVVEASLLEVFPHVVVLPFERFWFVATRAGGILTDDPAEIDRRLGTRGIAADYFRDQVLAGIFPERIVSYRQGIDLWARGARLNTDEKPFAYHAGLMLWEARSGTSGGGIIALLQEVRWWMAGAALVLFVVISLCVRGRGASRVQAAWALSAIGFASIAAEIALLVHYQMAMGLLVWRIGLIVTAFMVGAGLGATGGVRWFGAHKASARTIGFLLVLFAGYLPLMFLVAKASFFLANFLMGLVSGFIYQGVASELVADGLGVGHSAGIVEAADHWGAAVGALAASIVVIPLAGLFPALVMASAVLLAAAIVQLRGRFSKEITY